MKPIAPLPHLFGLVTLALGCGDSSAIADSPAGTSGASSVSTSIHIVSPAGGWASEIEYSSRAEGPVLILDGVVFQLGNQGSYSIDFEAIGMKGIQIRNADFNVKSTETPETAFFLVEGKEVRIVDGLLRLGEEEIGRVERGSRVSVDGGLTIL